MMVKNRGVTGSYVPACNPPFQLPVGAIGVTVSVLLVAAMTDDHFCALLRRVRKILRRFYHNVEGDSEIKDRFRRSCRFAPRHEWHLQLIVNVNQE